MSGSRKETRILRVRTADGEGGTREWSFDKDHWYVVTDSHPEIEFFVEGAPLRPAARGGKPEVGKIEQAPDPHDRDAPTWRKWLLGEALASRRRMGAFECTLSVPENQALRCYVVPNKFLDVDDYLGMVEDIEHECGTPAMWDVRPADTRTWVDQQRQQAPLSMQQLLELVDLELKAVRSLVRAPLESVVGPGGQSLPPPEQALIARWAGRRMHHLAVAVSEVERVIERERGLRHEPMPDGRAAPLYEEIRRLETLGQQLRLTRARVAAHIRPEQMGAPIAFGPLAQRDHRLRRLLGAFDPSRTEIPTVRAKTTWSHLPPATFNDLFERWGAVWLARQLRAFGFTGGKPEIFGADHLRAARWRLKLGDVSVTFDYESHPTLLSFDGLPPVERRAETAIEWAARRQMSDPERPVFGTKPASSPDYLLRFEGPGGKLLAVGDATLADPKRHCEKPQDSKVAKVDEYRDSLYWWADGRAIPCEPMGAFVLFLGPPEFWSPLAGIPQGRDIWLICPRPRGRDDAAAGRFNRFVARLTECAQARGRVGSPLPVEARIRAGLVAEAAHRP